jgi:hypothetical protein
LTTREAISTGSLTLTFKHYRGDDDEEHIDINQTLGDGTSVTSVNRILDWTEREADDRVFGPVVSKTRRVKLEEIKNEYLKKGWLPDTAKHGAINSYVRSDTPKSHTSWVTEQVRALVNNYSDDRLNDTNRSRASRRSKSNPGRKKGGIRGTQISQARKKRIFRFVWCTITVSNLFANV